ncbi:MAG: membrane protein insertase YidC [Candidatus Lambdaproteobacteria bacterium]|nr:membrane protein insertase YidC [Candidatus Lambdaproteobacteria bacterium]
MDIRTTLAVVLSVAVIAGYYLLFAPAPPAPPPAEPRPPAEAAPPARPAGISAAPTPALPAARPTAARLVRVETPLYAAEFDTLGGALVSLQLKRYLVGKPQTDWGDLIPWLRQYIDKPKFEPGATVQMVRRELPDAAVFGVRFAEDAERGRALARLVFAADRDSLVLGGQGAKAATLALTATGPDGLSVVKTFTFHADSYVLDFEQQVLNYGRKPLQLRVQTVFGEGPRSYDDASSVFSGPMYREEKKVRTEKSKSIEGQLVVRNPDWLGITDPFFLTAVSPLSQISHAFYWAAKVPLAGSQEEHWSAAYAVELPQVLLEPGSQIRSTYKAYFGPKEVGEMTRFGNGLEQSQDLTLDFLARPLLAMLRWFYGFTGNYGVAIILLTIVVRVGLFPLTYRGMLSMKRMSKLQPKVQALREKFKNDREKLNREMMGLYKRYRINPLGGCLPILLQIPVFFALYSALLGAIELRHSPFIFWLNDLSSKDALYVTPLLMGVSMVIQQRLTPSTLDPIQQKMMQWLPLVFVVFMFNFPSGLVVYWLTSNLLSIAQQLILNRVQIPELEPKG